MFIGLPGDIVVHFSKRVIQNGQKHIHNNQKNENHVRNEKSGSDESVGVLQPYEIKPSQSHGQHIRRCCNEGSVVLVYWSKYKEGCVGVRHKEQHEHKEERLEWSAADFHGLHKHGHPPIETNQLEKLQEGKENAES